MSVHLSITETFPLIFMIERCFKVCTMYMPTVADSVGKQWRHNDDDWCDKNDHSKTKNRLSSAVGLKATVVD